MKNILLLLGLITVTLLFSSCEKGELGPWVRGVGPVETETRAVNHFSRLEVKDHIEVVISQGDQPEVRLEAQRNVLEVVEARVSGDQLVLRTTRPIAGKNTKRVRAFVTVPALSEIAVGDHAAVRSSSAWSAGTFRLRVKDHGTAELLLGQVDNLLTAVKDHASLKLSGRARRQEVSGHGHASVQAFDLSSEQAAVDVDDHASVQIQVSGQLHATARDHGHVSYRGQPAVSVHTSGHGQVGATN
ncbi:head GIN domain-containing protein [Hymenobacter sp. B81]|uniref:head GIN domain-containing protein n=1 Tax=Hymenobacter sp. B81 TaxID=3344878 RepID=UPI0037DD57FD